MFNVYVEIITKLSACKSVRASIIKIETLDAVVSRNI